MTWSWLRMRARRRRRRMSAKNRVILAHNPRFGAGGLALPAVRRTGLKGRMSASAAGRMGVLMKDGPRLATRGRTIRFLRTQKARPPAIDLGRGAAAGPRRRPPRRKYRH